MVDFKFKQSDCIFDNLTLSSSPKKALKEQEEFNNHLLNDQTKTEIFTNLNFIREFRQSIQPYQTLIPNDISLYLKANNLQSINTSNETNETRFVNLKKKLESLEISSNSSNSNDLAKEVGINNFNNEISQGLSIEDFYASNKIFQQVSS